MSIMNLKEQMKDAVHLEGADFRKLSNGTNCYIIPKKGFVEKFAIISVNYGSADNNFTIDGQRYNMPEGIAHFLEHKLFEDENVVVFNEFNRLGANVNAFTTFSNTAYYFSCNENFESCLKLLLEFVQRPYFTNENVSKEKDIIVQEISMYMDNPQWAVYLNMMESMFYEYPVKNNIAGTAASVNEINKDMLYSCYTAFYRPENMALICVGDFDSNSVFEIAEAYIHPLKHVNVTRFYGDEPDTVSKNYVTRDMPLARKLFDIGYKDICFSGDVDIIKKIISSKIVLDYTLGDSSELFGRLYKGGLIDEPFSLEFICGKFFGSAIISSGGDDPKALAEMIINEINNVNSGNFDVNRFYRIVRKNTGRFMRGFNSLSNIAIAEADMFTKGVSIFSMIDGYKNICPDDFFLRTKELIKSNNHVLSVIQPI